MFRTKKDGSIHESYKDFVKETIKNQTFLIRGYSPKFKFELLMQKFQSLLTHGETIPTEWLQCYDIIVEGMDDWYVKRQLATSDEIKEMVRKLKSDEENEHSSFLCDLTDCKLCEARKQIEEEELDSSDSVRSRIHTDEEEIEE